MPLKLKLRGKTWQIDGSINGKRYRESTGLTDKSLAEQLRAQAEARLYREAIYGAESEYTFGQAVIDYKASGGREVKLLIPLIEEFGERRISGIKSGEITAFANKLKPNAKASSKNRMVIAPARAVIYAAAADGRCPYIKIRTFKEDKPTRKAANIAWLNAFRAHATHDRLAALAKFCFVTGARIGEAIQLTPDNFDFDQGVAFIDGSQRKTGAPRIFHLPADFVEELRALTPRRVKDGSLRLFGYLNTSGVRDAYKRTAKRAEIAHLPPHQAGRHAFATEMIVRHKVSLPTTAALGGWESLQTLGRYAHAEGLAEVAEEVFGTKLTQPAPMEAIK
jgi:integrase